MALKSNAIKMKPVTSEFMALTVYFGSNGPSIAFSIKKPAPLMKNSSGISKIIEIKKTYFIDPV